MRFQWWPAVLLEWNSNFANSCSVIEKRLLFWISNILQIFNFFQLLFCRWLGKAILTQITFIYFSFSYIFAFVIFYWLQKNRCPHFRTKSLSRMQSFWYVDSFISVISIKTFKSILVEPICEIVLFSRNNNNCIYLVIYKYQIKLQWKIHQKRLPKGLRPLEGGLSELKTTKCMINMIDQTD